MNSPSPPRRGPDARALAERLTGALDSASGLVLLEAESQALAAAGLDEAARIALGRRGEPAEVARWVLRLADPASTWLTG